MKKYIIKSAIMAVAVASFLGMFAISSNLISQVIITLGSASVFALCGKAWERIEEED